MTDWSNKFNYDGVYVTGVASDCTVISNTATPCGATGVTATCPAGYNVVGGGGYGWCHYLSVAYPQTSTTYTIYNTNWCGGSGCGDAWTAYAVCCQ